MIFFLLVIVIFFLTIISFVLRKNRTKSINPAPCSRNSPLSSGNFDNQFSQIFHATSNLLTDLKTCKFCIRTLCLNRISNLMFIRKNSVLACVCLDTSKSLHSFVLKSCTSLFILVLIQLEKNLCKNPYIFLCVVHCDYVVLFVITHLCCLFSFSCSSATLKLLKQFQHKMCATTS